MKKKVYFAGSIRGGRNDAELYMRLIERLKESSDVLTEHVGDLSLSSLEGEGGRDAAIYLRDTAWIRECDLLIAECTSPSHGVGYELAYAEKLNKPCFVLWNQDRASLSAMIKGDGYYKLFPYSTENEAMTIIDEIVNE
ncbi:MAG: nucleoside 2-deoxyribosyltransferase [Clostridiales bacterium]|nr:nucleoside 2-deoxyribosyltransferase [Clostridiales bacterium]